LFFNAAQQGTLNFIQAVGRNSGKVGAFAAGLVGWGYTTAVYNILNSPMDDNDEDDDELFRGDRSTLEYLEQQYLKGGIPKPKDARDTTYADYGDYALKRSLNLAKEDGSMITLPMAYGWMFLPNAGRLIAEWQYGLKSPEEVMMQLSQAFIDNFSPVDTAAGEGAETLRGFAPDIVSLWLDIVANKNYFGSPIQKEQLPFEDRKAQAYVTKRSTSKASKDFMQYLNDVNGTDYEDNKYLPFNYLSPDRIDYTMAWLMGGVGRFVGDVGDVGYKLATDPDAIEFTDYPVVGQFYKEPSEYTDQMQYYENSKIFASYMAEGEKYMFDPEMREKLKARGRDPLVTKQMQAIDKSVYATLRKIRKFEKEAELQITDPAELRRTLKIINMNKQNAYDTFNRAFNQAMDKSKEVRTEG
jgi:hypothetical protein